MAAPSTLHDFLDPPKDPSKGIGTLGHYDVIRELGKGGMGYVFLAEDTRLKRDVALKVMNQKIAATPGSRKRFISEARSMAAVHHDNVATIFEVGERNGTPYMAMELLEGATLENYRETHGPPDYHRIIDFARDIARGLGAAHAQGIVHRDIKPANIWLDTKTDRIKLLDFGLALAQTPVDQLSGRGAVVGTPGYLSPEQARSEPLDDRSDLYSAGVVLYELATGSLPLKTKTVAEQLIAILAHRPKPLRERNEEIPQPLADLIHRLMEKEPRDRFADAVALQTALDEAEVECEKSSEVAQAISQLQAGLEQAVQNKEQPSAGLFNESADSVPNPFETLPDTLPPADPASISGVHAAIPVASAGPLGPTPLGPTPAAKRPKPSAAPAASDRKMLYIGLGVAAAAIAVIIPAVVYFSTTSAIARQQDNAVVVENNVANPNRNQTNRNQNQPNNSKPASKNSNSQGSNSQGSNSQGSNNNTKQNQTAPALSLPSVTVVNAKQVKEVSEKGARWILGNKQGNGSFEQTKVTPGQTSVPGWTLTKSGPEAGWERNDSVRQEEAKTFAYVGKNSEALFVSNPANHQTKAGDRFRLSANVGGAGQGMSDYRFVLGFQSGSGEPTRFQLAKLTVSEKWGGGKQRKLRYEFTADPSVAGKKPFVEVWISNKNRIRKRSMIDRVVLTVVPNAAKVAGDPAATVNVKSASNQSTNKQSSNKQGSNKQGTTPIAEMKSNVASNSNPATNPAPTKPANPSPVRQVVLKTS